MIWIAPTIYKGLLMHLALAKPQNDLTEPQTFQIRLPNEVKK